MNSHLDLMTKNIKRFAILLLIVVSLTSLVTINAASEEYTVKFRGIVITVHQSHYPSLVNYYDDVVEVQITEALMGPDWFDVEPNIPDFLPNLKKYYVYLMDDSFAKFDDVQVGDFVEVYGVYPSCQAISGPYDVKLTESQHYLKWFLAVLCG